MRKLLTIVSLLIPFFYICKAQKLPRHEKKIYVSPDHRIFYNKSLPVYFYISASADPNAPRYLLKSETTPKYSNPMYFDTEGRNTLRSPSAVDTITQKKVMPQIDVEYQVYVDSKPPSTQIGYDKSKVNYIKGVHYISGPASVTFTAKDELSGVENTYVSIDSGTFGPVSNNLILDKEKEFILKYYSADNTGNVENLKEIKLSVDNTPPVSKLNVNGQKYEDVMPGDAKLEISAQDNISGVRHIYMSLDDSIFKPYTGKINTSLLWQGEHKLFYYSVDEVNNKETVNIYAFYVDKTPPQVIEEIMGKTFTVNGKDFAAGTSKLKITAIDNKAGVKDIYYSINKAAYVKYEKPILLSGFKGDLLVTSYAVDNVGNQSKSNISNSRKNTISYVDLSAPWIGHSFRGPGSRNRDTTFIGNKTKIILEAKDTESGINRIEYQIDSSDLIKYDLPFSLEKEGRHHISVFGYDNTENLTRQAFTVVVDATGPSIFETFSSLELGTIESNGERFKQYPDNVVVFLSATDAMSGFESLQYELNNNPVLPYTRDIRNFISGKLNRIKIKALDKLGNKSEKVVEFYVK